MPVDGIAIALQRLLREYDNATEPDFSERWMEAIEEAKIALADWQEDAADWHRLFCPRGKDMSPEEATAFAKKCFEDRGVRVGKELPSSDLGNIYFRSGSSCHSRTFECPETMADNYIHFHAGKDEWWDVPELKDAPEVRIRHMVVNGEDIPESECYPA